MKLALMQPYFFPYLGYFDLMRAVDLWIVFDTVQHIRRGWMHRNRILHPEQGWQYILVPLQKHPRETPICDVLISDHAGWRDRIRRQLDHYRRHAPHYDTTMSLVEKCLSHDERHLSRLNTSILATMATALGIEFRYQYLSELNLDLPPIRHAGDWAVQVCRLLGADQYVNPPGGRELYCQEEFTEHGIQLRIQEPLAYRYRCPPYTFHPCLSIVDVCMWQGIERLRARFSLGAETPSSTPRPVLPHPHLGSLDYLGNPIQ